MDRGGNPGLEAQLAASLDWWRDAGVDALFHDEPVNWIRPAKADDKLDNERPRAGGDREQTDRNRSDDRGPRLREDAKPVETPALNDFPNTLSEFTTWWLAEPLLDAGRTTGRVPPRGPANPGLMILVAEPERDDGERLLSGPEGKLLDAMLAAMGLAPDEAYVASILPRHTPHPDWDGIARLGIGRAAAHHVALVAPRALISFGQNIPSLAGHHPANKPANLPLFHHDDWKVPWLSDRSLGAMLERPRWKAGFWQRWLDFGEPARSGTG